ncbi:MAG: hypothetical protein AB1578_12625 [Thermodesulfobacteriota bacterium]
MAEPSVGTRSPQRAYRRLPGRLWLTLAGGHSLWLGQDHLLSVHSLPFSEEYRRFDYREIQALLLRPTRRRAVYAAVLGGVALLLGLSALAASGPVAFVPAVPGVFVLLALAVNWLRGPSCACQVRTSVHTEDLRCLRRARPARKALALLRERVEATQGRLAREGLRERFGGEAAPAVARDLGPEPGA